MLEKIEGIIIKTADYGETHKIVTLYSKKIGKFSAVARGAKKPKSRMAAVTQPFIHGEYLVRLTKGLSTIQQGEIINSFRGIREDIVKTAYCAYILELTDKLADEKKPDPFLYEQLMLTMEWINEKEDLHVPIMMYELKLFEKGGFAPVFNRCANCGRKEGPFAFSIAEGGFLCNQCALNDRERIVLPNTIAKLLYIFQTVGLERIGSISVKPENINLMRNLLDAYYDTYGGYQLKTKRFLKQLYKL